MSEFDIFAWIVLIILVASVVAVCASPAGCPDTSQKPLPIRTRRP